MVNHQAPPRFQNEFMQTSSSKEYNKNKLGYKLYELNSNINNRKAEYYIYPSIKMAVIPNNKDQLTSPLEMTSIPELQSRGKSTTGNMIDSAKDYYFKEKDTEYFLRPDFSNKPGFKPRKFSVIETKNDNPEFHPEFFRSEKRQGPSYSTVQPKNKLETQVSKEKRLIQTNNPQYFISNNSKSMIKVLK